MIKQDYLKRHRIEENFTQEMISKALGIKRSTYAAYETGKNRVPLEILAKLSLLYGIPLERFVDGFWENTLQNADREVEKKLLQFYQKSNPEQKEMIQKYMTFLSHRNHRMLKN